MFNVRSLKRDEVYASKITHSSNISYTVGHSVHLRSAWDHYEALKKNLGMVKVEFVICKLEEVEVVDVKL